MKIERVSQKISSALKDNTVTAKEASEIRDDILELTVSDQQKLKDQINIKELTTDAKTVIVDLYSDRENLFAFSQEQRNLIKSISFQRVLPNFMSLSVVEQQQILKTFEPILKKFPNFFEKLAKLQNDNYGKGFQFYFTSKSSDELGKIVTYSNKDMVGMVKPGANVIKNPILNNLVSPIAGFKQLDVGAMYIDVTDTNELLSHEMAHVVHLNFLNDDQRDKIGNLFDHAKSTHSFISDYAKTNPYEYFADSVGAYFSTEIQESTFAKGFFCSKNESLKTVDPEMYQFIKEVYESGPQYGKDGSLLNDPETIDLTYAKVAGKNLVGVTVGRESSLVTLEHFNGGTVSELALLGNNTSGIAKGSFGLKAAWKPWFAPVSTYGTAGATANGGIAGGKITAGIGGFVGAGIDIYNFNTEFRQNFVTNGSGPEVRVGYKIEF